MTRPKKMYWFAQIGGWGLLSTFILLASISDKREELINGYTKEESKQIQFYLDVLGSFLFFVVGILITHSMRYFFVRLKWLQLKLAPLIPRVLTITILGSALMAVIFYAISFIEVSYLNTKPKGFSFAEFLLVIFTYMIFMSLWNGVYFTFHFFQRSNDQELSNLQLTASHNEIELKNLRSQLNPHFLFNSLNTIRALIEIEPESAKTNITKLSHLLRKSLIVNDQMIPLEEELSIVKDYIDLEKTRFEERVQVHFEHDESLNSFKIPPFILQTLVENAFKHGISKRIEGGAIWIKTKKSGNEIFLIVKNEGKIVENTEIGIGIQNTKRRLELQFKGTTNFELLEKDNFVSAIIQIENKL